MINPMIPAINTIISQSAPLIPRDSASLYTQMQSRIATMNQTIGKRQSRPPMKKNSICPASIGITFSPRGLFYFERFIRFALDM